MKNILLSFGLFLLLPCLTFCQNRIITGSISGNYNSNKYVLSNNNSNIINDNLNQKNLYVNSSYLQKVTKNWYAGGQVAFSIWNYSLLKLDTNNTLLTTGDINKSISVEFSGVARSNFLKKGDFTLFGTHSIGYEASQSIEESSTKKVKYTGNTFIISSRLGINYEINPHWFLRTSFGSLSYQFTKRKNLSTLEINNNGRFDANFGLSSFGFGAEYHF